MKPGVIFWLGFALLNPFTLAGLLEAFFIQTGRATISQRLGPQVQGNEVFFGLTMLFLGSILTWLVLHLTSKAQTG